MRSSLTLEIWSSPSPQATVLKGLFHGDEAIARITVLSFKLLSVVKPKPNAASRFVV